MQRVGQRLAGLMLAICASTAAMAQAPDCVVRHQPFAASSVAQGHMRVLNNGKPCGFTFKFGGSFDPSEWKVEEAPKHGRIVAAGSRVDYFPEAGYSGPDAFTVAVFGNDPMLKQLHQKRNGRFAFAVEVRAAD